MTEETRLASRSHSGTKPQNTQPISVRDPSPVEERFGEEVNMTEKCEGGFCEGRNEATEPHTCPYAEDINDDSVTLCNCCEFCTDSCADEI